jgi:hypothetical protein
MASWFTSHYYLAASLASLALVFACGSWTHLSRLLVAIMGKRCDTEELDQIREQVHAMSNRINAMSEGNGYMSERIDVVSKRVDMVEDAQAGAKVL